jgi:hypothetical protein
MASLFKPNKSRASELAGKRAQQAETSLGNQGDVFAQQYQGALPALSETQKYFLQRAGLIDVGPNGEVIYSGYGTPKTTAPLGTASGLNQGKSFAGFGSRRNLPGFQETQAANTQTGPSLQERMNDRILGIYNSPEYRLLRQAAEEDINRQTVNTGRAYNNQLLGRGLQNSSLQTGGQAAITAAGNKTYSDFTRQQAMNAANKQDQLVGQALQSLSPSLVAGQSATSAYGNMGELSNAGIGINQAVKNQQGSIAEGILNQLGSAAGAYLGGYGKTAGAGGGGGDITDASQIVGDISGFKAQGGSVLKDHTYVVGEGGGPEAFIPQQHIGGLLRVFAGLIDKHMEHNKPALPKRARGGDVSSNRAYLVGEEGPEVFTPDQNGMIIPNPNTLHPNISSVLQFALDQGIS